MANIKKLRDGSVLVETHTETQSRALLKLTRFFDQVPVSVQVHPTLNTSTGAGAYGLDCRRNQV